MGWCAQRFGEERQLTARVPVDYGENHRLTEALGECRCPREAGVPMIELIAP